MKKILIVLGGFAAIFFLFLIWSPFLRTSSVDSYRPYRINIQDREFEIIFPSEPYIDSVPVNNAGVENVQYSAGASNEMYFVSISLFNPGFTKKEQDFFTQKNNLFVDTFNKDLLDNEKFTVNYSEEMNFNGSLARIYQAKSSIGVNLRYIVFTNNIDEYFVIAYMSKEDNLNEKNWNRFVTSFRVI
jgi:hypothetical protein